MHRILRVLGALLLAAAGIGALLLLAILRQGGIDERRPVDAIVVLGAAQYDGRPSPVFAARLDHAADLWDAGLATTFVVTGGRMPGDRTTEAAVARDYALERGVPATAILGEDEARNTLDSLRAVAAIMRERGLRSALLVSDPTHMLRCLTIARDLGIDAWGSPAPAAPVAADPVRTARAALHELGALVAYWLGALD